AFSGDGGVSTAAKVNQPSGVTIDASGNVYISDQSNARIRKIDASTQVITTTAGNGFGSYGIGFYGDGKIATLAELAEPEDVAIDTVNTYIVDLNNQRIRKVNNASGIINTVCGNGSYGYNGDGISAASAELYDPTGIAVDDSGNIYIADQGNQRVRKIYASTGIIATIAGNGTQGYTGDGGAANSAELYNPTGVAVDGSRNVYIADATNNVVRKVSASTGEISTIAGTGAKGFTGDGGHADSAEFYDPSKLFLDASGNLFIVDAGNNRIREVITSTGIVHTVAGSGSPSYSGDGGLAINAGMSPAAVSIDMSGNLYIVDRGSNTIRKVSSITHIITTIAGTTSAGYNGDSILATTAELRAPNGIALDPMRNIYISDGDNNRVRKIDVFDMISQPASTYVCLMGDTSFTVKASGSGNTYQWQVNTGSGFSNVVNSGLYSGATLATLHITGASLGMNGYTYRCLLSGTFSRTMISDTVILNIANPTVTITLSSKSDTLCNGSAITLSGNGAVSYSWNNGITNAIPFNPSASGKYVITGTDTHGCKNKDSLNIVVNPTPIVTISGLGKICHGSDILTAIASGASPFKYLWNTSGTNDTIMVNKGNTYSVTVTDANGCKSDSSFVVISDSVAGVSICMVSVDSTSTKNLIIWDKPAKGAIDSFRIYREIASTFKHIASLPYNAMSIYTDTTNGINPNTTSYQYKLSVIDTCGNESVLSPFHKTIHVSIGPASPCGYNLNWNDYIEFPITQYRILRDSANTGWKVKDSVSFGNTSWTDATCYPTGDIISYQVEAINPTACNPTVNGPIDIMSTHSNQQGNAVTGINVMNANNNEISVFPNPVNQILNIKFSTTQSIEAAISITDVTGRIIMESENEITPNTILPINTTDLQAGIYFVRIISKTSVQVVKFIKE
ncbi:MAG TPA: T9SS type A sorting domain-containing protein, partial [Bacteroidia bacterium]|nr:T9SS type A sorting domain-containing protein [Bacteroidia bacterium]